MKKIPFRIFAINVKDFSCSTSNEDTKGMQLQLAFGFAVSRVGQKIKCTGEIDYVNNGKNLMHITTECEFAIEPDAFKEMVDDERTIIVEKDFLQYLATIVVGTARGEMHARLEMANSDLKRFVLPPINLTEILKEDLAMPIA